MQRWSTFISSESLLIVPTATMAEHARHSLARSGFPVRPREIRTLAHFLEDWAPKLPRPRLFLDLLIEQAWNGCGRSASPRWRDFRGFAGRWRISLKGRPGGSSGGSGGAGGGNERDLKARGKGLRHARCEARRRGPP